MNSVTIIGASAGGWTVADSLRRRGFDGQITMIGDELHRPYDRPPLSKQILRDEWTHDRVELSESASLDALGLDLRLGVAATGLNVPDKRVLLSDGTELGWERLVVATGVRPRRRWMDDDLAGVHVLKTLDDAVALKQSLQGATRLVVIGAGFLGAEVAAVARGLGLDVTVVDPLEGFVVRQLGKHVSDLVGELHAEHGVRTHFGVGVKALEPAAGRVQAVHLDNGLRLPADVVVIGIGSTPATDWLADSGLSLTNGVDCDEAGCAAPGIYAVGDVANWWNPVAGRRVRVEHRMNAADQGLAVARTLLGEPADAALQVPYFWTDQYKTRIQVYGEPSPAHRFEVFDKTVDGKMRFSGGYFDEAGRMAAGLCWNMPKQGGSLRERVLADNSERLARNG